MTLYRILQYFFFLAVIPSCVFSRAIERRDLIGNGICVHDLLESGLVVAWLGESWYLVSVHFLPT